MIYDKIIVGDKMKQTVKNSYLFKLLVFIILLVGMATFSSIPAYCFHLDIANFKTIYKIIYLISCDLVFMFIIYILYHKSLNKNFKDYFKKFITNFEESFKYYFIGLIVMLVSNLTIALFFSEATAGNEELVRTYIDNYPLYMIFSVAIYAPFIEEMIFRKSIKDIFLLKHNNKLTKYLYILTSGLVFGGMHLLGQITNPLDWLYIIPYSALGIAFAALYYKTDNIFSTIAIHCLHNTITIILYLTSGGM